MYWIWWPTQTRIRAYSELFLDRRTWWLESLCWRPTSGRICKKGNSAGPYSLDHCTRAKMTHFHSYSEATNWGQTLFILGVLSEIVCPHVDIDDERWFPNQTSDFEAIPKWDRSAMAERHVCSVHWCFQTSSRSASSLGSRSARTAHKDGGTLELTIERVFSPFLSSPLYDDNEHCLISLDRHHLLHCALSDIHCVFYLISSNAILLQDHHILTSVMCPLQWFVAEDVDAALPHWKCVLLIAVCLLSLLMSLRLSHEIDEWETP